MNQFATQARQFWLTRTSRQRLFLAVIALATVGLVGLFASLMATPNYKVLMTGMDPADAQTLSTALSGKKIPFQLSADGKSISVPADQLDAARLQAADSKTQSGRMGFEIFDKASWGQTEFDEKVNYQRALEGELERTIMTMGGVKNARVHLVMATESVFLDREQGAKASVTLKLGNNGLTREQASAIQRLVAGAVSGLKPADVAIIDTDSNELLGGDESPGEEGLERQLTQRLMTTLWPVVGNDHLRASVNVEYDPSTVEESVDKYDPAVSVPLTTQRSEEQSGPGAGVGGVPGTTSNVPQSTPNVPPPAGEDGVQTSKTENATYAVNKTSRRSVEPAGRIRRITAALIVDDAIVRKPGPKQTWTESRTKRSPQELQQIQILAANAIGVDTARGDVITVQNLSFMNANLSELPKPSALDRARKGISDYASALRYLMMLLLFGLAYALMIRPLQKTVLSTLVELPKEPVLAVPDAVPALPEPALSHADVARTLALKEQVIQQAKAEPAQSVRAIQAWLQGASE
ncbi:MAG: flagellar basal-body MS-ring/collar protein FliF [Janthinobacterium lividum]